MSKRITLMIVPEGGDKVFTRNIPSHIFKLLIVLASIWIVFLVGITVIYSRLAAQAAKSAMLEGENHRLRQYFARVVDIEKSFKKNQELTARLAEMAGVNLQDSLRPQINFDSLPVSSQDAQAASAMIDSEQLGTSMTPDQLDKQRIPEGRPLYGWITRSFQDSDNDEEAKHTGIDLAVKEETDVRATASGVVLFAGWDENLGNLVVIDHQNGFLTSYGHNKKLLVEKGQKVLKGDVIALSGNTGHSSAPHLHYEIMKDGAPVDPTPYLD